MRPHRLILMRHGEASEPMFGGDHGRRLTEHGLAQAEHVARQLQALGWLPEVVLCSTAARALATARAVHAALAPDADLREVAALYDGDPDDVLRAVTTLEPGLRTALLVGHNPTFSVAASDLCGASVGLHTADAALLTTNAVSFAAAGEAWDLTHHVQGRVG